MSLGTRISFSNLLKGLSWSTSGCFDVGAPPAEPLVSQSLPPENHVSSCPPPRTPSPTIPPQVPTHTIASSTSLQPPGHELDNEVPSSGLNTSSSDPFAPSWLPPVPPPSQSLASHQVAGSGSFSGAHHFNIHDPHFNDYGSRNRVIINSQINEFSLAGSGLRELLKNSMPDAFHDSATRYPPPKCHLGTRKQYIAKITDWALGNSDNNEPILWMCGPFGAGKSAIAQSCAEALNAANKLVATLFFSRSNKDRDDPRRVFTSISFQIATKYKLFSDIVDARIREDPSLTTKSLPVQFNDLVVRPLSQVDIAGSGIDKCVVIIDGLDECRGSLDQCEIVRIIAASARDRTTPFKWFTTSRPEDPIIRTTKSVIVSAVSLHLELPVSRETDHEILLYLTDEFNEIRESHGLGESWPGEEAVSLVVEMAAGLWIYVTTIVRFIKDERSYGPEDQLRVVLQLMKDVCTRVGEDNPFVEMEYATNPGKDQERSPRYLAHLFCYLLGTKSHYFCDAAL